MASPFGSSGPETISLIIGEALSAPDVKKAAEAKAKAATASAIGLLWNVPSVRDTDMLTPVPIYEYLDEKVYFSLDLENEPNFQDPFIVELYKSKNSLDLHIRATNTGEYDEGSDEDPMNMIKPEFIVFLAAVVNGDGKTIRQEKFARSYMAKGNPCWEIPSFIPAAEFDMEKLLTTAGGLQIRLSFDRKKYSPNATATAVDPVSASVDNTADPNAQASKSNAMEKLEKFGTSNKETLNHNNFVNLTLDGFPARFKQWLNREKFTDGVIHVALPGKAGTKCSKQSFLVHFAILILLVS